MKLLFDLKTSHRIMKKSFFFLALSIALLSCSDHSIENRNKDNKSIRVGKYCKGLL